MNMITGTILKKMKRENFGIAPLVSIIYDDGDIEKNVNVKG